MSFEFSGNESLSTWKRKPPILLRLLWRLALNVFGLFWTVLGGRREARIRCADACCNKPDRMQEWFRVRVR